MRIRKGDKVQVISGLDKGTISRVSSVDKEANKVVVEGIHTVTKHIRPNKQNPQGGRLQIDKPIDMSNVMVVCESCGKASRMGARVLEDGTKERYCKKCGAGNGQISKAKKA